MSTLRRGRPPFGRGADKKLFVEHLSSERSLGLLYFPKAEAGGVNPSLRKALFRGPKVCPPPSLKVWKRSGGGKVRSTTVKPFHRGSRLGRPTAPHKVLAGMAKALSVAGRFEGFKAYSPRSGEENSVSLF